MAEAARSQHSPIPPLYRLFFLYVEPLASLVGAYYALCNPHEYLRLTDPSIAFPKQLTLSTSIILIQLSNLYFLFTINEALVLRATSDINVWRTLLFCLLIADVGHLYSVHPLGFQIYWNLLGWNAIDWGNIGFVYMGATMRICFLAGLGLQASPSKRHSKRRLKKS